MANWKEIAGYEGMYIISDEGVVVSLPRIITNYRGSYERPQKELKPGHRGKGNLQYEFVVLFKDGKCDHRSVHRLVAEAFLENPDNLPEVNHKDENPLNNHVDNLEWCSRQYNIEYSKNKAVVQMDMDGEEIAEYKSVNYASDITGVGRTSISNCLNGWSESAGGYKWKSKERE